ncbi:ribonuclease T [Gammaproteobacteria bacterium 45_16_T64]|nr:ribonuclease T [Gammaproteobacteria bacterium 45_16_T64]
MSSDGKSPLAARFRGFLPVVIDVETGGFNAKTDALLEIAAVTVKMDDEGILSLGESFHYHVEPFEGANMEKEALEFTGIDPYHPFRNAVDEKQALTDIFNPIRQQIKSEGCNRAILVGHNAVFDHDFVKAATSRQGIKRNPFHPFSCFDTATLAGLAVGQTVLAKACRAANIPFDNREAHSAIYDAKRTAELFCYIVNRWQMLGGLEGIELG